MSTRELLQVSAKSIAAFYARWTPGTQVECINNTYRAAAIGTTAAVLPNSTGTYTRLELREPGKPAKSAVIRRPKRVGDVTELTEDSITYAIFTDSLEHTATWRIVAEAVS